MPRNEQQFRYAELGRGLNLRDHPAELAVGESCSLYDVVPNGHAFKQRPGDVLVANFPATADRVIDALPTGDGNALFVSDLGHVFAVGPGGVLAAVPGGATNMRPPAFAFHAPSPTQGPYFMGSGNSLNTMYYTDGTFAPLHWTASSGTLPDAAMFGLYAGNRAWLAELAESTYPGVLDRGSTVVSSDIGNARSWPATNVYQFSPLDGEILSAFATLGPYIVVFKPSQAWLIYDLDSGANRPIGFGIGCAKRGGGLVVETPDGLIFPAPDGRLMVTDGSSVKTFDDRLQPMLRFFLDERNFGVPSFEGATMMNACYFREHIYFQIQNFIYDFDRQTKTWWRHRSHNGASDGIENLIAANLNPTGSAIFPGLFTVEGTPPQQRLVNFMGDPLTHKYGDATDLAPVWRSGLMDFSDSHNKRLRGFVVDGEPSDAKITTSIYSDATYSNFIPANSEGPGWVPAGLLETSAQVGLPHRGFAGGVAKRFLAELAIDTTAGTGATNLQALTMRASLRAR